MSGPSRTATPAEQTILEPACRYDFSLLAGTRERLACTAEASAFLADCGRDWLVRRVRVWFNNNRDRLGTPRAGRLPLVRAVQEGLGAVNDRLQRLSDRLDALEKRAEERHLLLLSRLEPYPECQLVCTALLVGRTSLPLRIVSDPSFRAFMREFAIPPSPSSGTPS
jgi:hypothetical protein